MLEPPTYKIRERYWYVTFKMAADLPYMFYLFFPPLPHFSSHARPAYSHATYKYYN